MAEYDIENVEEGMLVSESTFILKGNDIKRVNPSFKTFFVYSLAPNNDKSL